MFQHDCVETNDQAEGYNFKLKNKKRISKHPDPYVLVDVFKQEFSESLDDAISAKRRVVILTRSAKAEI